MGEDSISRTVIERLDSQSSNTVINVIDLGVKSDGLTDAASVINSLTMNNYSNIYFPSGKYLIAENVYLKDKRLIFDNGAKVVVNNKEITLDNCYIQSNVQQIFTGNGYVRGVLCNESIYHQWFEINYNVILSTARTKHIEIADIYVDSILGDDANDGLTVSSCLRTIKVAIDRVANLVKSNVNRSTDIKIVFRTGRYEIDTPITIRKNCCLDNAKVIFKSMNGENAEFTPLREYYFTTKQPSKWYNSHPVYSHNIGNPIYSLWESDTDNEVICANSINNRTLNRNQNNHINFEAINGIEYAKIAADTDVIAKLSQIDKDDLNCTLVITWQWFTQTFARLEMLSEGIIYYKNMIPSNVSKTDYGDGYYTFADSGRNAPYYLLNCLGYLTDSNFYSSAQSIYLPVKYKHSYYTSKKISGSPIKLENVNNVTFKNLTFKNFVYSQSTIESIWNGGWIQFIIEGSGVSNKSIIIDGCVFKDSEISAASIVNSIECKVINNYCLNIGSGGFNLSDDTAFIDNNFCDNISKLVVNSGGIWVIGRNFTISNNVINRYGYNGIRCNQPSITVGNAYIFRNVISNGGCDNEGRFDETRALMDGGAIYTTGRVNGNKVKLEVYENIIYNYYGHAQYRGIYCDDGVSNQYIHDNLIYNVQHYTIDCRQVYNTNGIYGGTIDVPLSINNRVSRNIVGGPMRLEGGRDSTKPNYGEALGNVLDADNIILCDKNYNASNAFSGLASTKYIKNIPFFIDSKNIGLDIRMVQTKGYYAKPYIFKFINPYSISFVPSDQEIFKEVIFKSSNATGNTALLGKWTKIMSVTLVGEWVTRHIRLFYYVPYHDYNYGEITMNFSTMSSTSTTLPVQFYVKPIGAKTHIVGQNDFIIVYNKIDSNTWVAELYVKINTSYREVNFYVNFVDGDYNNNPSVIFYSTQPFLSDLPTGTQVIPFVTIGTTAQRPIGIEEGYNYYDTTLEKPIWYKGSSVWIDATGTKV